MKPWWGWVNWVIAASLVAFGAVLVWCPRLMGSAESAAVLAGALFGAAALFAGAEITKREQRVNAREALEETRASIRTALMAELVRICANHMETAKFFRAAADDLAQGQVEPSIVDFERYMPPEPFIYRALIAQITSLPAREIDALATFYGSLDLTRETLREATPNEPLRMMQAHALASCCKHDCEMAAEVVALLAPQRKIQRQGEEAVLLTQALREAAGQRPV